MNRVALAALLAFTPVAFAQPDAPRSVPATKITAPGAAQPQAPKKAPRAPIYDESADARQQIAAALKKAGKEHRRVLIQWGANWCGWCHLLHDKFKEPAIAKELLYEYDLVLVDIGHFDKNKDLAASYGAELKGVPYLTVLDASGKAIANQETGSLEAKDENGKPGHDAARVLAFLKANEAPHPQADAVLAAAISQASASNRLVFLHFGAPWCGWCHRLEDWLAREDVAPLIARDFVDLKIDQDRMPGGKELESQMGMPEKSGIPWFLFLDPATGKPVVSSTGPNGNIGFPAADDEIAHFMTMLGKARKNLTAADLERLKGTLLKQQK